MAASATLYLPLSTSVYVRSYTNAAFTQRVTLVEESGTRHQYQGSGEGNTPMAGGSFTIRTPGSASDPRGYAVTATVESYYQGSWKPSAVISGPCQVMTYNQQTLVSEDYLDDDWNDTLVQLCWWSTR